LDDLQTHRITKPVVIGHSLGGTPAIDLATQHAELLGGVVAINGLPIYPTNENMPPDQRAARATWWKSVALPDQFVAFVRAYILPSLVTAPADVTAIADASRGTNPVTAAQRFFEDSTIDLRPVLKNANVPLLEIGPYDRSLDERLTL